MVFTFSSPNHHFFEANFAFTIRSFLGKPIGFFMLVTITSIIIAWISYRCIEKNGSLGTQGVDSKYGVTKGSVDTRLGQAKDGGTDYQLV